MKQWEKVCGLGESRCGFQFRCKQTRRKALCSKHDGAKAASLASDWQESSNNNNKHTILQAIAAVNSHLRRIYSKLITKYIISTYYFLPTADYFSDAVLVVTRITKRSRPRFICAHGCPENLHIVRMRSKLITRSGIPRCCLSPTADCSPSLPTLDASCP